MTDTQWTPGRQFRYWREQAGLLMQQVADELRVSQQAVSSWEADVAMPRLRILDLIDEVYGLKPGMAATITDKRNPPQPPDGVEDPLIVDLADDGAPIWSARVVVDEIAAASGVDMASLTPANRRKAREFIEYLLAQQADRKKK